MKKRLFPFLFLLTTCIISKAQVINCGSFCVSDITYDSISPFNMNVTISCNTGAGQVNYPSVLVVNNVGDTIANPTENFYFFAQVPGSTVVHSIPTIDSTLAGLPYTIYFQDNIYFNGCVFTYPMICNVGINEQNNTENQTLVLYPNPAKNTVNINVSDLVSKNSNMMIINIMGEVVYQKAINELQTTLDVSDFAKGIYFVLVIKNDCVLREKLSVE